MLSACHIARYLHRPALGSDFRSDQDSQDASVAHPDALAASEMLARTSGKGDCNATAFSVNFFDTLEFVLLRQSVCVHRDMVQQQVAPFCSGVRQPGRVRNRTAGRRLVSQQRRGYCLGVFLRQVRSMISFIGAGDTWQLVSGGTSSATESCRWGLPP
jgi:hypothetical protein